MEVTALYLPWTCAIAGYIWAVICFLIVRKNEREENIQENSIYFIKILTFLAITIVAIFLPSPINLSVSITLAGFIPTAWSDWKTKYLWDEVIIPTGLLSACVMMIGGRGGESLAGGVLLGLGYYILWAIMTIFKKEIGFGDVKMATVIGFTLGPVAGIFAFLVACFAGILLWIYRRNINKDPEIPFGPALAFGTTVGAFFVFYLDNYYFWLLPSWFAVKP